MMQKKIFSFLAVAALGCLAIPAQAQSFTEWQDTYVNEINRAPMRSSFFSYSSKEEAMENQKENSKFFKSLHGKWKFNYTENAFDRPTDFFKLGYNVMHWDDIMVPGIWERNGYGDAIYINPGYAWSSVARVLPADSPTAGSKTSTKTSSVSGSSSGEAGENNFILQATDKYGIPAVENAVGSYVKNIEISQDWIGREIFIHFGSATSNLYLWVNGKFVGYSEDSKLACEFNLTPYLKAGVNTIAFQIMRWSDGSWLEDQDFFRLSGLAREVYMYAREELHLEDIQIVTDLDDNYKDAELQISSTLSGRGAVVSYELMDGDELVASTEVKATNAGVADAVMQIENPEKWNSDKPYLYTLLTTVKNAKGEVMEVVPQRVGFREIEIKNSQVLINGQPVFFKGVDRHELDPDGGYLISRERMLQDIEMLKKLNFNAVRTSHYPNDPYWYELCDIYGIYLVSEANIEAHGMGYGPENLGSDARFELAHLQRTGRMQQCYKNHPSVIFWSMGNESGDGDNFRAAYKAMKEYDTTRPVQYDRSIYDVKGNTYTDIWSPMYTRYGALESLGKHEPENYQQTPLPVILCEYAHAMGNSVGGFKEYWDIFRKYDNLQGGFIWDWVDQSQRDYRGEDGKDMIYTYGGDYGRYTVDDNNFCSNGVVSPDRVPNPHAYEIAYIQQNIWATPVDLAKGEIEVYNEYFFKNLDNYLMEWTLLQDGKAVQRGAVNDIAVEPQQTTKVALPYSLPADMSGEWLLNVDFKLKNSDGILDAGYRVAYEQMPLSDYDKYVAGVDAKGADLRLHPNTRAVMVVGENFHCYISRTTGLITDYVVDGHSMLEEGFSIRPSFWRAPTDNDMGAGLQQKNRVWYNPSARVRKIESEVKQDGLIEVSVSLYYSKLEADLNLVYTFNGDGEIGIKQSLETASDDLKSTYLFRFGMELTMPSYYDYLGYYGRGTVENYWDRNNGAKLTLHRGKVADEFYSYIRPQETGNHTDMRWMEVVTIGNRGLKFTSSRPFSASALHYLTEDLDDGVQKDHRHSGELKARKLTNIHIDGLQTGLGCEDSWGAVPREEYRIPYGDYDFDFVISPVGFKR